MEIGPIRLDGVKLVAGISLDTKYSVIINDTYILDLADCEIRCEGTNTSVKTENGMISFICRDAAMSAALYFQLTNIYANPEKWKLDTKSIWHYEKQQRFTLTDKEIYDATINS